MNDDNMIKYEPILPKCVVKLLTVTTIVVVVVGLSVIVNDVWGDTLRSIDYVAVYKTAEDMFTILAPLVAVTFGVFLGGLFLWTLSKTIRTFPPY